jgi:ankyrin repeat protein
MEPPIPWDVQCDSVNGLKEAASFDKDAKATQAHFQLAVAYRIGFGLEMSPSKAQFHLQSMRLQDPVAEAVVKRISTSLEHEQSDWSSIQKSIPAPESAENFSEHFRDLYQADYQNLTGQLPADVHDIMLNAKEHPFDVKPSVFHWLILVPPSKARAVLSQYKSKHHSTWKDSEKRVLDLSVSEPIIIREFCLELFGTPLHWAVRTANIQLLELLIEFGADVNVCWGTTILAEVERPRTAYMSPLGLATMYHLESITRLLLDVGAEPSWNGCSAAHMIGERTIPFSRAVLHAGNSRMAAQRTIAVLASYYSRKDTLGHTPLSRALGNPNAEAYVIEELIAGSLRGDIALGESDHNLCCIVARACSARRFSSWKLSLIESLLTDIDGTDRTGLNALHIAAQAGSHDVVEFLIDHGADVNTMTTDSSHNTALALAARNGCTTVVELLLVAHAQLELTNNCDETALEQAIIASNREIVSLLIGAGAKTTFSKTTFSCDEDAIGSTILHAAAKSKPGSLSTIVRKLIRDFAELCKSYVNVSDYQGWTPLHYSAYYGNLRDTKALLDLGAVVLPSWSTALIDLLQSVIEDAQNQQFAPEHALIEREGPEAVRDFIGRLSGIIIELEQHVKPESS